MIFGNVEAQGTINCKITISSMTLPRVCRNKCTWLGSNLYIFDRKCSQKRRIRIGYKKLISLMKMFV